MSRNHSQQDDYNNLGVCHQFMSNLDAARSTFEEGTRRFYHSEKLHMNLGLLLEDLTQSAWIRGHADHPGTDMLSAESNKHLVMALRLQV